MSPDEKRQNGFVLDPDTGYFRSAGVEVMAFSDFYPAGHQSGVTVIMHGNRLATNGDLRFEQTPGQWQPLPAQGERRLLPQENAITTQLSYPDPRQHLKGFNPMLFPDFSFGYSVTVRGVGPSVEVTVDLDRPIPEKYTGKLSFNLELFPGALFGRPWIMDEQSGIFPPQPNGPVQAMPSNYEYTDWAEREPGDAIRTQLSGNNQGYSPIIADDWIAAPYASGQTFTVCPDDPYNRITVRSLGPQLHLYDGRMNHNNGWFVLSAEIAPGTAEGAVRWLITPSVVEDWRYAPVVQVSQVGYHPAQSKVAVVEMDRRSEAPADAELWRINADGPALVRTLPAVPWGNFLRYHYLRADFSDLQRPGLYQIRCGGSASAIFRVAEDVYARGVWQPVLEYFLPVQMCHMRVNEKYRVWHGLCHNDDARMAPLDFLHFDGYRQGPETLTRYQPGEHVPGLNAGGWHDAGDFDLRVESQSGECYIMAAAFEAFGVDYDATTIDQEKKITEIHQPDGKNDLLQQIEHGLLTVVGGYRALGRLYRGIICGDLRQYVMLGDAADMTDNVPSEDDRWVFTEDNPPRELTVASHLAASARAMRGFNDELGAEALKAAEELYAVTDDSGDAMVPKLLAACELLLTTGKAMYRDFVLSHRELILQEMEKTGWAVARAYDALQPDAGFDAAFRSALLKLRDHFTEMSAETPYGIPYRPYIWGAGWLIEAMGFRYYFLVRAFPEIFSPEMLYSALNFLLGCHPGSNTASFASGVGAHSATVAYGANRADWSYIPGGVISGTALIRPDLPELLTFPYLWQQTEYVLGGGSSHYMFLVLAAQSLLKK